MIRCHLIKIIALFVFLIPSQALSFCFDEAGRNYGVSPALLRGIARVESGMRPDAVNYNSNGSADFGLMQVNSFWLKALKTTSRELLENGCFNVMAGAWILRDCLDRHGETWNAVGCYNASSHDKRVNYSWKVYRELLKGSKTAPYMENGMEARVTVSRLPHPVSSIEISVFDIK